MGDLDNPRHIVAIIKYPIEAAVYANGQLVFPEGHVHSISLDKFEVLAAFADWLTNTKPEAVYSMTENLWKLTESMDSMSNSEYKVWIELFNILQEYAILQGVT